jgi:primosomal protein N' (replication factor Y)
VQTGHHLVESQRGIGSSLTDGAPANAKSSAAADLLVLGPAEAPIAVIRGRHRFRILVKAARGFDLQSFLRAMIAAAPKPRGGVRVAVDVDPQSFL